MEIRQTVVFKKWRESLTDTRIRTAIAKRMIRIQAGNFGDAKYVGEGVGELRFDIGPGYRVYFHRRGEVLLLLLCGGDKSTQSKDIQNAKAMVAQSEI